GLAVMWTNLRGRGLSLADLTRLMSAAPAKLAGLESHKGKLAAGYDADIVIWNPEKQFTVVPELIQHRHKLTPYSGMELFGKIEQTFVGGRKVFGNGQFDGEKFGKLLT
ncbi:MAG: amidohydrolase family protein, partial [Pyrinomonadaceae bacterium]